VQLSVEQEVIRSRLRVLVACEKSGIVRRAFAAEGYDAWSCDLQAAEDGSNKHVICDVRDLLNDGWDLLVVMHPPCTRLCNSGARWYTKPPTNPPSDCTPEEARMWPGMTESAKLDLMFELLDRGAALFSDCWNAPVERIAVENPVMHWRAKERIENFEELTQSVQPWQFGTDPNGPDNEKKRTCFWLKRLPKLIPTGTLDGTSARDSVHRASPGAQRGIDRSRFFPGLAGAMAAQWGAHAEQEVLQAGMHLV